MTTEDCIKEIEEIIASNTSIDPSAKYAVLRPVEKYEGVNFSEVAKHFKTEKINAYSHPDKIVIEL